MVKRGELVKVYDRIDISVITQILDQYYDHRAAAKYKMEEEEVKTLDTMGPTARALELLHPTDAKLNQAADGLGAAFESLRAGMIDNDILKAKD